MSTVLVTGGNRGLGAETVRLLAGKGHHVVLTARDVAQGEEHARVVRAMNPSAKIDVLALDLASFASVRACAEAYRTAGWPLHVLIANAARYAPEGKREQTADGHELHFASNHLGHHLLISLLLDRLRASAPSRVVVMGSGLHAGVPGTPPSVMEWDDLDWTKAPYDGTRAYARSKLACTLFAYELDRRERERGIRANVVSPRVVPATLVRHTTGMRRFFTQYVMPLFPIARTPERAAASIVFAALDPSLEGKGGLYLEDDVAIRSSPASYVEADAAKLWALSDSLVGLAG
jgi:NAD(P)-dependent dehydrogenase (short-subunit alcohol dehydrogenase family)